MHSYLPMPCMPRDDVVFEKDAPWLDFRGEFRLLLLCSSSIFKAACY